MNVPSSSLMSFFPLQVSEKPVPVRISSLLTPRHLSQRRIRLPARKYHPKIDGQRVRLFLELKYYGYLVLQLFLMDLIE